jgi:dolichyl-diphosphooligosaccharide---protein glycosyltransferase
LYTLGNGGDESKKQWFIRIGGFNENKYLEQDGVTPTPLFWNTTFLGQLIPFTVQGYASRTNVEAQYSPGTIAIYSKNIKYPESSGNNSQPLNLVYSSPSFNSNDPGIVFGVLIYKVNPNYVPNKL